jgi:hypothetical protein
MEKLVMSRKASVIWTDGEMLALENIYSSSWKDYSEYNNGRGRKAELYGTVKWLNILGQQIWSVFC